MNGYELMADSYRTAAGNGQIPADEAEQKAKIYDLLATFTDEDLYAMIDSTAFNDIIRAYCRLALEQAGVDEDTRQSVMSEFRFIFSEKTAKEVCNK